MKIRKKLSYALAFCIVCGTTPAGLPRLQVAQTSTPHLEWPEVPEGKRVVEHTSFSLLFEATHRQSRWVAYVLKSEHTWGTEPRINRFLPDPQLPGLTATDADYRRSGYDRGHLVPAADMSWSAQALRESFFYSNVSPQLPAFNRGIWKRLETLIRSWARNDSALYVVTGPVLCDTLPKLNGLVSVPRYFFKSVLCYSHNRKKGIGFILEDKRSELPLQGFAVSIDSVEQFTGLNLFAALPDSEEEQIEKNLCLSCWKSLNSQ